MATCPRCGERMIADPWRTRVIPTGKPLDVTAALAAVDDSIATETYRHQHCPRCQYEYTENDRGEAI